MTSNSQVVLSQIGPLDPTGLSTVTARAVDELLREGDSANTLASYRSALRYWAAWFRLRYGQDLRLPVAPGVVLQFVVDHAQRSSASGLAHELPPAIDEALVKACFKGKPGPMALNTLVHRIAVLSKAHRLKGLENPCESPQVRELLSKTRRAYGKRGALPQKKDALTREPLLAMLQTCDDSLKGLRDRALLLFAWSTGGRRRSEVASAQMHQLRRNGPGSYTFVLAYSKTNQAGLDRPENYKPVEGSAGAALQAWLAAAAIEVGPIFRQVKKGGSVGEGLSPAAVRDIVRARARLAGLPDVFSAHSLRSGFVTEAAQQKIPLPETMAMTGHRSVASVLGYFRASGSSRAATLLDSAEAEQPLQPPSAQPPHSS